MTRTILLLALTVVVGCGDDADSRRRDAGAADAAASADAVAVDASPGDPRLASIALSYNGSPLVDVVTPTFDPATMTYAVSVGLAEQAVEIAATPVVASTTITVGAVSVAAGVPTNDLPLALGAQTFTLVGTATDGTTATYTVTVTRAAAVGPTGYFKQSNTSASSLFGYSVALDGNTLVVGAPGEPSNATGVDGTETDTSAASAGAVYVFTRSGATWMQQAYLKASNTDVGDEFGYSVAISGDTIAVGAIDEDSAATGVGGTQTDNTKSNSGAVYVFTRAGTTWSQQAYVKASNTDAGDAFGEALALSGDTLVVGAPYEASASMTINAGQTDNTELGRGAAYVFTRAGTTWTQQVYLKPSNLGYIFGFAVTVAGDTVAVGAPQESNAVGGINGNEGSGSSMYAGAVYVFTRAGTTWTQQAYLKMPTVEAQAELGYAVSLSGDTLAVGAIGEASATTGVNGTQTGSGAAASGAAYLFTRAGTTWTQQAFIKAANAGSGDEFGWTLAVSGDTLAIGAIFEASDATTVNGNGSDNSATSAGAAYVFTRTGTTWSQQAYLKAANASGGDELGASVAASGDLVVVGAYGEDSNATGVGGDETNNADGQSGAVYAFE